MNRRGILGLLGISPLVGADLANSLYANSNAANTAGALGGETKPYLTPNSMGDEDWAKDQLRDAVDSLSKLFSDRETWIRERKRTCYYELRHHPRVDVDIIAMKSISDVAKLHMQAERNAIMQYDFEIILHQDRKKKMTEKLKQFAKLL